MGKIDLGKVVGERGERGSLIYSGIAITGKQTLGTVFPDSGIDYALQEDKYLNTLTNDMYTCITEGNANTAEWAWIGNIQGEQGIPGEPGPTGQVDENTPIKFESGDELNPNSYEDIPLLESGSALKILINRFSTTVKNVRYLAKIIGSTDISKIGNGTVTGALSELNSNLDVKISETGNNACLIKVKNAFILSLNAVPISRIESILTEFAINKVFSINGFYTTTENEYSIGSIISHGTNNVQIYTRAYADALRVEVNSGYFTGIGILS